MHGAGRLEYPEYKTAQATKRDVEEQCAKQAEPNPTTVDDLLVQKLHQLANEIVRVVRLRERTPTTILHRPARDIRELAQLL